MTQQDGWRGQSIKAAETAILGAKPELDAIVTDAVRGHGLRFQRPEAAKQAAAIFSEIQNRSFQLGIKIGMEMVLKSLENKESEEKHQ